MLLLLCCIEWTIAYALELASNGLPAKIFWAKAHYFGLAPLPVAWLAFALQHTGRGSWIRPWRVIALLAIPCLTIVMAWTNDQHGLLWSHIELDNTAPFPVSKVSHGSYFWVNIIYTYGLVVIAIFLLLRSVVRSPELYRGQASALLVGMLVPLVGSLLHLSGHSPIPYIDLTPFSFSIAALAISWGLIRYRLLDVVPVAHDAVIENMSDALIVLDEQDRILELNPAARRLVRQPSGEIIGKNAEQVFGALRPDLVARYRDVAEVRAEIGLGEGWYDLRISSLHNRRGQLTGRLIVLRDITELKRTQVKLSQARDMAEAASQAKSAFLANMSHELRTPLNSIIGYTDLLLQQVYGPLNPQQEERLKTVIRNAHQLLQLINDILDLSKIEAGRVEMDIKPFAVEPVVMESLLSFRPQAEKKGLVLSHVIPEELPSVVGDRNRTLQVMSNLLSNAIKFTPQGSVRVRIQHLASGKGEALPPGIPLPPAGWMLIEVADTGIGIAPENHELIFDEFRQVDETITREYEGTGLGLAISRKLVSMMGGHIWVESTPGEGSTSMCYCQSRFEQPG